MRYGKYVVGSEIVLAGLGLIAILLVGAQTAIKSLSPTSDGIWFLPVVAHQVWFPYIIVIYCAALVVLWALMTLLAITKGDDSAEVIRLLRKETIQTDSGNKDSADILVQLDEHLLIGADLPGDLTRIIQQWKPNADGEELWSDARRITAALDRNNIIREEPRLQSAGIRSYTQSTYFLTDLGKQVMRKLKQTR